MPNFPQSRTMSSVKRVTEDYQSYLPWMVLANAMLFSTLLCIIIAYFVGPTLLRLYCACIALASCEEWGSETVEPHIASPSKLHLDHNHDSNRDDFTDRDSDPETSRMTWPAFMPSSINPSDFRRLWRLLPSGFPRQAAAHHELCGVRLNFSMPHVTSTLTQRTIYPTSLSTSFRPIHPPAFSPPIAPSPSHLPLPNFHSFSTQTQTQSIGLGGGSLVRQDSTTGRVTIGPDSVGYRITDEALVFGGKTLTATDVSDGEGASEKAEAEGLVEKAQERIRVMLENTLDAMKTSQADLPVYLVGGGSILIKEGVRMRGLSRVCRFGWFDVANAVGAAIAQISGTIDTVADISTKPMAEVRASIEKQAIEKATEAGADAEKASSTSAPTSTTPANKVEKVKEEMKEAVETFGEKVKGVFHHKTAPKESKGANEGAKEMKEVDDDLETAQAILDYKPRITASISNAKKLEWHISATDLAWIAEGCYVLGCGGGGSPHHVFLQLREAVRAGEGIRVVDLGYFDDESSGEVEKEGGLVGWGGGMGSPEVSSERLLGEEYGQAMEELLEFMRIDKQRLKALVALEIGGANGMINMTLSSSGCMNIPILDGDFMGRAYPTGWQVTPNVYDPSERSLNILPAAIASGDGNYMVMTKAKKSMDVDSALRAACCEMGTHVGFANKPLPIAGSLLRTSMIRNTVSLSWRLGRALALASKGGNIGNVGKVLVDALGGEKTGEFFLVARSSTLRGGHTIGEVHIAALAVDDEDVDDEVEGQVQRFEGTTVIPFKNENLYAEVDQGDGSGKKIVATVPDLIAVLDAQSGCALRTPDYKYGLRVLVLGITAAPQWTSTARGLELGDLRAFGFEGIPWCAAGRVCPAEERD
ncbi:DUF917-domain-containing protein [Stereum hirsutum FP-91666 SS1]|uniref:DUF917-domain-containing protein n=1 Tax=Stereum hirsutum (strain FP-91666) TaxID=721885 RepID=UPI00044493D6|nr:DUF917-domain-containing protein [Stereum hirsutum FP-91666 SS1]EIM84142.1 DUF917-domain-containing protein [Stereum hirsutum FP-91666 SS1]